MRQSTLWPPSGAAGQRAAAASGRWSLTPLPDAAAQVRFEVRNLAFRLVDGLAADRLERERASEGWVRTNDEGEFIDDELVHTETWTGVRSLDWQHLVCCKPDVKTDLLGVADGRTADLSWERDGVTDAEVHALAAVLRDNRSVQSICLSGNPAITRASLQSVLEVLPEVRKRIFRAILYPK